MSEEKLNEEYIKGKLQGVCQDCMWLDKTLPIIREMLSEAYIKGLKQYRFDLKMDVFTEKVAIPEELAEDKSFVDLCEMPSYRDLYEKNEYLKSKIENKDKWCQLIADIGYDYDGFNQVESLKALIDELVKYALYSRDNYDYAEWEKEGENNE